MKLDYQEALNEA